MTDMKQDDLSTTEQKQDKSGRMKEIMNGMRKNWVPWAITGFVIIVLIIVVVRSTYFSNDKAVATMQGYTLTKTEVFNKMEQNLGKEALGSFINDIMVQQMMELDAKKAGIEITDAQVKKEIDRYMQESGVKTEKDLEKMLQQSGGVTLQKFKEERVKPMLRQKLLFAKAHKVSDKELKDFYEKNKKELFHSPKQVKASHILVETKKEAEAVLAELKAGKDFADLAKKKSTDKSNKDKGGDLGYFGSNQMDKNFEKVAFSLKKGQLSDIVKTQFGYHIIKVADIKKEGIKPFDKEDVEEVYYTDKMKELGPKWIEKLKEERHLANSLDTKEKDNKTVPKK